MPERFTMNKRQLAIALGVSVNSVDKWILRGCPVVQRGGAGEPWAFDLAAVIRWRDTRHLTNGRSDPDSMLPTDRRAWYSAEKTKTEVERLRGQLVTRPNAEAACTAAYAAIAAELATVPDALQSHGVPAPVAALVAAGLKQALVGFEERVQELGSEGY